MAVGIMILPAAAARFWTISVGGLIAVAAALALFSSYSGLLLSYYLSLPSGPAIILVAGSLYFFSIVFGLRGGVVQQNRSIRTIEI